MYRQVSPERQSLPQVLHPVWQALLVVLQQEGQAAPQEGRAGDPEH